MKAPRRRDGHDRGQPTLPADAAGSRDTKDTARAAGGRRLFSSPLQRNASIALVLILLTAIGTWTYLGVRNSLRELRAAALGTVLDAEVKALEVWIEGKKAHAQRWAGDPRIRACARELGHIAGQGAASGERLWQSPARRGLYQTLQPFLDDDGSVAANLLDPSGLILATPFEAYSGQRVTPAALRELQQVFSGKTRFVRPFPEQERVRVQPLPAFSRPVLWIEAPVRDEDGAVIAALGFAEYADEDFATILGVARMGASGEAYGFDQSGLMLSETPFVRELQRAGALPPGASPRIMLRLQVRDPGGDLLQGHQPAAAPAARPLTRLAAAAIASIGKTDAADQRGTLLEPYRNYRGAEVIGAWRWLPEYEMGIAVEVSAEESYAPLHYLDVAFAAVLGLALLAAGAAVLVSVYESGTGRRRGQLREIGHYVLIKEVGEGGMSKVYFARHALMMRPTAVKIMKPHVATDEMIARFQREVRQTARLTHPNTIRIYDYGRGRDGSFFYAMEFLDGICLDQLVARDGRVPVPRVIHVLRGVCGSLKEAHAKGLIHRDIKPPNVMLCEQGGEHDVVKVLDFGLVKDLDRPDSRDITKSLRVLGTPLYMAPERIRNVGAADVRTDVYSIGAVAFNMLTGERLFESGNDLDLAEKVLNSPPRRPSQCAAQQIPAELDDLLLACLAKDPQQRPAGVNELQNALDRLAQRYPWTQDDAARWWAQYRASDVRGRET